MSHARPGRSVRPTSRYSGVTRVGLRVALVAGMAGAAWLFCASGAFAADGSDSTKPASAGVLQPLTSSVLSLLGGIGTSAPAGPTGAEASSPATAPSATSHGDPQPAGDVLTAVTTPLIGLTSDVLSGVLAPTSTVPAVGTAAPARKPGASGTDATARVLRHRGGARGVRSTSDVAFGRAANQAAPQQLAAPAVDRDDAVYAGSDDLVRTVSDIVAPLGLTDLVQAPLGLLQPMIGITDPILAPLAGVLRPVTAVLRCLAVPVTTVLGAVTRPVAAIVLRSTVDARAPAAAPMGTTRDAKPTPMMSAGLVPVAAMVTMTPVRVEAGTSARTYHRTGTRGTPAALHRSSGERNLPTRPAPRPALPDLDPGAISTAWSGSHESGGGFAILSIPVADGSVAGHRLLAAAGVEARHLHAEVPTVSPD
jgi:hypothetical protein